MCRSIQTLHNVEPPYTEEEVRAAAVQFVRKITGHTRPTRANEGSFARAVDRIAEVTMQLLLETVATTEPRSRADEAARRKQRWVRRASR